MLTNKFKQNSEFLHRACNSGKRQAAGNGIHSQDQLLSQSTDDQEEYSLVAPLISNFSY